MESFAVGSGASVTVRIKLSSDAAKALRRPLAGQGGFQSAIGRVQELIDREDVVTLTVDDVGYLVGLATKYHQGGFQTRLAIVLKDLISPAP